MSIESVISYQLNKHPALKKMVKRIYQRGMCAISHSVSTEGDITKISPNDNAEYFFGYYDKSPWDRTDRYMLCMRAKDTWSETAPLEPADIILIDTLENNAVRVLATTHSWNVQQGCMAQWLGPNFDRNIIYNDYRDGQYCSVILDIADGTERMLPMPVYTVSADGNTALSLDFSRLHRLRPGYGYANIPDKTTAEKLPDSTCIWKLDPKSAAAAPILKYTDLAKFEPRPEMKDAVHKVNHLMLSPNGRRFMLLHRWFHGHRKYTRLVTCNIDGTEMFNLSDDDMVSHCFWKNDTEILAFENKRDGGTGYYLMKDKTHEYSKMWPELAGDGHPSYSPDGALVVTDTYPNRKRIAEVRVMQGDIVQPVARVFAPFKYDNDTRCDLHPRWSRDGRKICFDAVFEGHRGLYTTNAPIEHYDIQKTQPTSHCNDYGMVSVIIPTYKRSDTLDRAISSALAQTYPNLEILVVDDNTAGDQYSVGVRAKVDTYGAKVKYIEQEKHINGAAARNAGIRAAKGIFIAFLDDDDEWMPNKISTQMEFLIKHPECAGVACLYRIINNGVLVRQYSPYECNDLQRKVFERSVAILMPTTLMRKNAILESGGFNETLLRHQDLQFYVDFLQVNSMCLVPECLVNIYSDSAANKQNAKSLITTKKAFFALEKEKLDAYPPKIRKEILSAHYFEIILVAVRNREFFIALQYMMKIGLNFKAYKKLLTRYHQRKSG